MQSADFKFEFGVSILERYKSKLARETRNCARMLGNERADYDSLLVRM